MITMAEITVKSIEAVLKNKKYKIASISRKYDQSGCRY
jgi:hypothetical protein